MHGKQWSMHVRRLEEIKDGNCYCKNEEEIKDGNIRSDSNNKQQQ
jgi:hypothetical protein